MTNIHRAGTSSTSNGQNGVTSNSPPSAVPQIPPQQCAKPSTGAIPKTTKPKAKPAAESSTTHSNSLNRISKSSLQWLLVNKWLPMWIGQESDCNVLDFNFMFSRDCGGCSNSLNRQQSVVRFNSEMNTRMDQRVRPIGGSMRPMRLNHSLTRLRESQNGSLMRRENSLEERSNRERFRIEDYNHYDRPRMRQRSDSSREATSDPFRNWELNAEHNSFRPAGGLKDIRRITDGTFPQQSGSSSQFNVSSSAIGSNRNMIRERKDGLTKKVSGTTLKTMERLVTPRMDSRTESGNESPSPDLGRRYSDNTEDDQHNDDEDISDMDDD